jgi:hypothetical protein
VAPFFVLSFFVYPSADDYSIFNLLSQFGFWGYQKYMYLNWTGRYTGNLLETLDPLNCLFLYRIIPVVLLIFLYFSIFTLFKVLLKKFLCVKQLILFTLVFFTLYLNNFPSPGEGIYWFPAEVHYLLANVLTLFYAAVILYMIKQPVRKKVLSWIVAVLIAFIIIGLNEISLLLVCGFTLIVLMSQTYIHHKISFWLAFLFIIIVAFAVFVIVAPGNYVRMSYFPDAMNLGQSVVNASFSLVKLLGIYFQNPPFILISFLTIPFIVSVIEKHQLGFFIRMNPLLLALFSLLLIYVLYVPGFLSMGINPPMRINALISLVFMLLWLMNLVNLCHFLHRKKTVVPAFPDILVKILLVCTVILVLSDFYKEPGKEYYFRSNIPRAY